MGSPQLEEVPFPGFLRVRVLSKVFVTVPLGTVQDIRNVLNHSSRWILLLFAAYNISCIL